MDSVVFHQFRQRICCSHASLPRSPLVWGLRRSHRKGYVCLKRSTFLKRQTETKRGFLSFNWLSSAVLGKFKMCNEFKANLSVKLPLQANQMWYTESQIRWVGVSNFCSLERFIWRFFFLHVISCVISAPHYLYFFGCPYCCPKTFPSEPLCKLNKNKARYGFFIHSTCILLPYYIPYSPTLSPNHMCSRNPLAPRNCSPTNLQSALWGWSKLALWNMAAYPIKPSSSQAT